VQQHKIATTMKEVAQRAGVSTATVSRAFSHPEKLSAATRYRVEEAVISSGYTVQVPPQSTNGRIILVMIDSIDDPLNARILAGMKQAIRQNAYLLLIDDLELIDGPLLKPSNRVIAREIGAVIQIGNSDRSGQLQAYGLHSLPRILIGCSDGADNTVTVDVDHLSAAFNAVNFLCELGYSRIAYLSGPPGDFVASQHERGYQLALQRKKIAVESRYIERCEISPLAAQRAAEGLMTLPQPPNAIYCRHDTLALGVLSQFQQLKFDASCRPAVIGFGNVAAASLLSPMLSTMQYPANLIGIQSINTLIEWLNQPTKKPKPCLFDSEIIQRETTNKRQY
jgi:LacI family repressor for deo operon, udp, cdd, tsx, nupC, and nupG